MHGTLTHYSRRRDVSSGVGQSGTRTVKIDRKDFERLQAAYGKFLAAYTQTPTPLIRDRIRDYAIAALRAFKRFSDLDPRAARAPLHATGLNGRR